MLNECGDVLVAMGNPVASGLGEISSGCDMMPRVWRRRVEAMGNPVASGLGEIASGCDMMPVCRVCGDVALKRWEIPSRVAWGKSPQVAM